MKLKPNLFIVGAAKAGTTSLYSYLQQHPQVFMSPIKEPHYFSKDIRCENFTQTGCMNACFDIKKYLSKKILEKKHIAFISNIDNYLELFRDVKDEKVIGEISTGYLYSEKAAREIYDFNQESKIIIVLRNPVDRAFSHWKMNLSSGRETLNNSFIDALHKDFTNIEKGYCKNHLYVELSQYYKQVDRYLSIFPRENINILFFDELKKDKEHFMSNIYTFLDLKTVSYSAIENKNVSAIPKYPFLKKIYSRLNLSNILPKKLHVIIKQKFTTNNFPVLSKKDQIFLYQHYFKKDIEQLERLLDMNLNFWKYGENK